MKYIKPSYEIMTPIDGNYILRFIERVGRTCYKSEGKITEDSASKFVAGLIKRGHEAMIEHYSLTVRFIVDRAAANEITRHRLASFAQESTRYCKYGDNIEVIPPVGYEDNAAYDTGVDVACYAYQHMIDDGITPEIARDVLPLSLKTELVMTANLREWRHFFKLRAEGVTGKPHPKLLAVTVPLLNELKTKLPIIFDDIMTEDK